MRKWITFLMATFLLVTGTAGVCTDVSAVQTGSGEAVLVDNPEDYTTPEYLQYLKDLENGNTAQYGGSFLRPARRGVAYAGQKTGKFRRLLGVYGERLP